MENLKTFVFFPQDDLPGSIRDQLLSDMGCHVFNRRFFITRDNLVGFGPSNIEPGDDVWIPGGSKVPFVFRPLDGPGPKEMGFSASGSGLHPARRWRTVVGDCYVHGVMEGEAAGMPEFVLFLK
ncbi:Heterokaryon incompatibility protein 6, OR allele [Diplodia seriata]|uniref:Heterokaryon incompatibility protein 6, OR allele n=1 Tax=Diplodia seriata TaxID=420778 RepID=A0A1S8B8S7_9PEZI|nr:Heterokaryon incompatibility protein 6, OR allele [Diplodia seriata]